MSNVLKDRVWALRIGDVVSNDIDFDFNIEKSVAAEPNTCSVTVYNLTEEHRRDIESLNIYEPVKGTRAASATSARVAKEGARKGAKAGNIQVEVHAGYKGIASLLFRGFLRRATSRWNNGTWTTEIEGEDGGHEVYGRRVSRSFPPGSTKLAVVTECAKSLGVGLGNIAEITSELSGVYAHGTVLDGGGADELRRVLRSVGATYSVQNGVLQFTKSNRGLNTVQATYIDGASGMVGVPARDATGMVEVGTLLIPNLAPGGYVTLGFKGFEGTYRIYRVNHEGSTSGNPWYHHLTLLRV